MSPVLADPEALTTAGWMPGEVLALTLFFRERVFVRQWLQFDESNGDFHRFRLVWETHWDAVGGGETITSGGLLEIDRLGRPSSYELFSDRLPLRIARLDSSRIRATLTDGSSFDLSNDPPAELVLQTNVIGGLALFLSLVGLSAERIETHYLAADAVARRPLQLERIEPTKGELSDQMSRLLVSLESTIVWRSSLGLLLACDSNMRLNSAATEDGTVTVERVTDPMPDVDLAALRKARVTYTPSDARHVRVEELQVAAPAGRLGAALTVPMRRSRLRSPGVLFIQGSGRHDRHGIAPGLDIGTHAIVDHISERGFVGLRFDSRGSGDTPFGSREHRGFEALVDDAGAALRYLIQRPDVDPRRIVVIGHSLGALVAMRLAVDPPGLNDLSALVLLAPPGRKIDAILIEQAEREAVRLGFTSEEIKDRQRRLGASLAKLRADATKDSSDAASDLTGFAGLTSSLLRDLAQIDPISLVREQRVPILVCQGAKDIQVSLMRDSVPLAYAAAEASVSLELRVFTDLDHFFKIEPGVSTPESYFVERPIGEEFLASLVSWLRRRAAHALVMTK